MSTGIISALIKQRYDGICYNDFRDAEDNLKIIPNTPLKPRFTQK